MMKILLFIYIFLFLSLIINQMYIYAILSLLLIPIAVYIKTRQKNIKIEEYKREIEIRDNLLKWGIKVD